jgi:hypothetical protein
MTNPACRNQGIHPDHLLALRVRTFLPKNGAGERASGNQPSMVLAEDGLPKGLAMLIRSEKDGIYGETAIAVSPAAIPAASVSTQLPGGLLLLISP